MIDKIIVRVYLEPVMRNLDLCINCGETRDIVSHGLCSRCYMRMRRAEETEGIPFGSPDRSQNRELQELNRIRTLISRFIEHLDQKRISQLVMSEPEYETVKDILNRILDKIQARQSRKTVITINSNFESTVNSNSESTEEDEKSPES